MIRAADDYDAIYEAMQQLRGNCVSSGLNVDIQWYIAKGDGGHHYKPITDRAKDSALGACSVDSDGFIGLGTWSPDEVKAHLKALDYVFEEVPAP